MYGQEKFQSTRSQDRDFILWGKSLCRCISIHSVARPRHEELCSLAYLGLFQSTRSQDRDQVSPRGCTLPQYFNPLGRKTETTRKGGEKMPDTFQSTRSQDRDKKEGKGITPPPISIHSVARPRQCQRGYNLLLLLFQSTRSQDRDTPPELAILVNVYFNPLGRKTETTFSRQQ